MGEHAGGAVPAFLASMPAPTNPHAELCEHLHEHIPEILVEWQSATAEEPWLSLPRADRVDYLPPVIRSLVDVALCGRSSLAVIRAHLYAAAAHGHDRREQGFAHDLLFSEYYLLRQAMWYYVRRLAPPLRASDAIMRIDEAITLSTRASLCGYYQPELERAGRWPAVMEELAADAPLRAADESQLPHSGPRRDV